MNDSQQGSTIIPAMRYRDAHAAIEWLCHAFGFTKQVVFDDPNGGVAHAQLTYGNGMIMLGSVRDDAYGARIAQPTDIGGRETQSPCVVVKDAKAHYEHAKTAGAEIIDDYAEAPHGGASYSCRDPEGHRWYFGSFNPWQA